MAIRVLLADDHTIVRDGLKYLLEAQGDIQVVGYAEDGRQAIAETQRLQPDIIVMDIGMPELNGIDAAAQIRSRAPAVRVIILSMFASREHIKRAFQAGVQGYLLKESAGQEVVSAVRSVHRGMRFVSQRISNLLVEALIDQRPENAASNPIDMLTLREREVLQLVVEGKSSADIAELLSLSPKTVDTYRSRLMNKLGVTDLPGLVKFALQHGIISLD